MNSTTIQAPTASGPASKERAAPAAPGGWVRVDRSFLDARTTPRKRNGEPISGRERLMWAILDGYCGPRPFCWPSTEELAAAYGCDVRTAFQILKEMDEDGIIRRVAEGPKGKRIGIILLKRINPDSAEMVEQEVPSMIALLRDAIEDSLTRRRTLPFEAGIARKTAHSKKSRYRSKKWSRKRAGTKTIRFNDNDQESLSPQPSFRRPRPPANPPPTSPPWSPRWPG